MTRGSVTPGQLVTVAIAAIVATTTGGILLTTVAPGTGPSTPITITATATANGTVALYHRGGTPITVTDLRVVVHVDGHPLDHQPPIPFFAATGFNAGPTGPFNSAADPTWREGETASFTIASTNHPTLSAGVTVVVRLYRDGQLLGIAHTSVTRVASPRDDRRRWPVTGSVDPVLDVGEPRR